MHVHTNKYPMAISHASCIIAKLHLVPYVQRYLALFLNITPSRDSAKYDFDKVIMLRKNLNLNLKVETNHFLKEHVALDRSSWSLKRVCNRLL